MGWLTDLSNVAVGAIERDRQITKEDLAIRADNLQANKDILIKQKEYTWAKELEDYETEKVKFDQLEAANAIFKIDGNDYNYAMTALPLTTPGWKDLDLKTRRDAILRFKGETFDYTLEGSRDQLHKKAALEMTAINDIVAKQIKDAKGDSFLIKKILRKKDSAEKNILESMESELESAKTIKLTETKLNPENVGLPVDVAGGDGVTGGLKRMTEEEAKSYVLRFEKLHDKAIYTNPQNARDILAWIKSVKLLGQDTEAAFTFNADDTEITGVGDAGSALAETYKNLYQIVWKNMKADTFASDGITRHELGGRVNNNEINKTVQAILLERYENIDTGKGGSWETNREFTAVIPLNILNINNKMVVGSGEKRKEVSLDMTKAKKWYKEFLTREAKKIEGRFDDDKNIKSLMEVQTLLETGRGYVTALEKFIEKKLEEDKAIKSKTEIEEGESKKSNVQFQVENGISGIYHPDFGFQSFEMLEKAGTIKATLEKYPHLKSEYDKWKLTQ